MYAAISRADPKRTETSKNETEKFFRKKSQKGPERA
jgi:hypothetical protein